MNNFRTAFALGCVTWLGLTGCAPNVLPLGDEPLAGSGGSTQAAGGKSVLPGSGGATHNDPPAEGGATLVDPPAEGGASQVDPPAEGGATQECYAPEHMPELAIDPGSSGCPCTNEPEECVRVQHEGRPWDVALYCVDGQWQSAEDGICWSGAQCVVDGEAYPSGARRVPTPYSLCNTCNCMDGELVACTGYKCADTPCPQGTFQARQCVQCGQVGGCVAWEIGCFGDPECESGTCGQLCY